MKKYRVSKTDKQKLSVNDLEWTRAEELRLEYCWASGAPRTSAYILRHESGLYVKFTSEEYPQRIEYREYNAPVNRDSCVEIFLAPDVNDTEHYINFEMNASGYMYLGYGTKACRSAISDVDFDIFCVEVERRNDGWELMLFIPFDFLKKYFENLTDVMRANLYKCADRSANPHHLAWSEVESERPLFHDPDYFGILNLS